MKLFARVRGRVLPALRPSIWVDEWVEIDQSNGVAFLPDRHVGELWIAARFAQIPPPERTIICHGVQVYAKHDDGSLELVHTG